MNFGKEFWLILFWEYISPKLFAVHTNAHKYLLARKGGQTPCQNKQELGTLTMGIGGLP
jgi:hypothetical protein